MTTAVDTVVPVAPGQVRVSRTRAFLVLAKSNDPLVHRAEDDWKIMILTGPMRTDIVTMTTRWIENWSEVVQP